MSSSPFFSVIIPTYNRPKLAERAIESVLQQECKDFEILLIDDGSLEDYTKLIQKYQSENKFTYHKQNNAYLPAARNKGIELARGKWICFLDDDDYYLPNHLEEFKILLDINDNKCAMYRTFTFFEDEDNVRVEQPLTCLSGNSGEYILKSIMTVNNVCLPRQILLQEKFDQELRIAEDYNLWLRLLSKIQLVESAAYTSVYFKSKDSMSGYNLNSTIKYIHSYMKTFDIEGVKQYIKYNERKLLIYKYINWYFDTLLKEKSGLSFKLILKVFFKYPDVLLLKLLIKFLGKKILKLV